MARAEASCIIRSAITRTQAVQAPVWPRIAPDQPVRHPARHRQPYRPRGVLRAESLALWGVQEASIPRQAFVPPPAPAFRRRGWVAAGVALSIAGTVIIALPTAQTPKPSLALQAPVMVSPQRPAPVVLPAAPAVPAVGRVVTRSTLPPIPQVQDEMPAFMAQAPQIGPAFAPRIAMSARPASASPTIAAPAPATGTFQCADCTSSALRLDGITITLLGDRTAQAGIADTIAAMGAEAVLYRPGAITAAAPQVRVYRAQDMATAQVLAARFGAVLVDVSWLSGAAPARIDVLLAQDASLPN